MHASKPLGANGVLASCIGACLNPAARVLRHQWDLFLQGADTPAWDRSLPARQEMLVLERLIKTSAVENTCMESLGTWVEA